jgi:hypothetical protein
MNECHFDECLGLTTGTMDRRRYLLPDTDVRSELIVWVRTRFGSGRLQRPLNWLYCVSFWIALPLAVLTSNGLLGLLVHCLALSGAVSFVEKMGESASPALADWQPIDVSGLALAELAFSKEVDHVQRSKAKHIES